MEDADHFSKAAIKLQTSRVSPSNKAATWLGHK